MRRAVVDYRSPLTLPRLRAGFVVIVPVVSQAPEGSSGTVRDGLETAAAYGAAAVSSLFAFAKAGARSVGAFIDAGVQAVAAFETAHRAGRHGPREDPPT